MQSVIPAGLLGYRCVNRTGKRRAVDVSDSSDAQIYAACTSTSCRYAFCT